MVVVVLPQMSSFCVFDKVFTKRLEGVGIFTLRVRREAHEHSALCTHRQNRRRSSWGCGLNIGQHHTWRECISCMCRDAGSRRFDIIDGSQGDDRRACGWLRHQ